MQTYWVLYAIDIPHYARFEIQAANSEEAIIAAKAKIASGDLVLQDPDRDLSILERIVRIEDETGNAIINDIPLDNYRLKTIAEAGPLRYSIDNTTILQDGRPIATLIAPKCGVEPLVGAGNCHSTLVDALRAAEAAIEEATDVMFSGEDGKPVKRLKPGDIEHVYLALCGVLVQVHEAINAGESV